MIDTFQEIQIFAPRPTCTAGYKMAVAVVNAVSSLRDYFKALRTLEKSNAADNNVQPVTDAELSEQAAYLCQQYIEHRLTRSNLLQRGRGKQIFEPKCSAEVLQTLCHMCKLLEEGHPSLFVNVLDQLNFRINLCILVRDMFIRVCEQIISSGITWARIIALYSFAGGLACDFSQHGDVRFIHNMPLWMAHFTRKHLGSWIRAHGGWVSIRYRFSIRLFEWNDSI